MAAKRQATTTAWEIAAQRLGQLNADRANRDERIVTATGDVLAALENVAAAETAADGDRAAALADFQAKIAHIDAAVEKARQAAEPAIADGVRRLAADKVPQGDIAQLTGQRTADIARMLKANPAKDRDDEPSAADVIGPEVAAPAVADPDAAGRRQPADKTPPVDTAPPVPVPA